MEDVAGFIFILAFVGLSGANVVYGLKAGKIYGKIGVISKLDDPGNFWMYFGIYCFLAIFGFAGFIMQWVPN